MIYSYNNFLFEEALNEAAFYILPELVKRFKGISDNPIAKKILDTKDKTIPLDITMLSTAPDDGQFSFLNSRKAIEILTKAAPRSEDLIKKIIAEPPSNLDDIIWETVFRMIRDANSMSTLRIGRFINRLFPGEFNDKQIEEFVNSYKAIIENFLGKFEIVSGLDIDHWYNSNNYSERKGSLGSSCMGDKRGFFDIYNKNEDVCKLLILKVGDAIIGRALIWKIQSSDSPEQFEYFMDRQYTIEDHDVLRFRKYADDNGWAYKAFNTHSNTKDISYKGKIFSCNMVIQLGDHKYSNYPYMDTFKRYNIQTHQLFNDNNDNIEYCYIISNTDGGYVETGERVYSDYHGRYILRRLAVQNSSLGWVLEADCVTVEGRDEPWPRTSRYIKNIGGKYYHEDDLIWSRKYRKYFLPNDVKQVIRFTDYFNFTTDQVPKDDIVIPENGEKEIWYKALNLFDRLESDFGYIKDETIIDYNGVIKPSAICISLFKSKLGYISSRDSEILGEEIDRYDDRIMDVYEYHLDMKEVISKVYDICSEKSLLDDSALYVICRMRKDEINKFNKYLSRLDENK